MQGVKDNGLLIGAHGSQQEQIMNSDAGSSTNGTVPIEATVAGVDAFLQDGVVTFLDHVARGLI